MLTKHQTEHFCTLFDSNYLPLGMSLHASLLTHAQPFHLWILCMDEKVEQQLKQLNLQFVTLIPLREVETPELLSVKPERSRGEYCWTLTPFTFQMVLDRNAEAERVTYLDADLFFFENPRVLLQELDQTGKQVLITKHAYAPEYDQAVENGVFCVQFITFHRSPESAKVMNWWRDRCLEWCFARSEAGKFGDQKYLDCWPEMFADEVHICQQPEKTLAPWNVRFFEAQYQGEINPVFYHFHGLRIIKPKQIQLYANYQVGQAAEKLYKTYLKTLLKSLELLWSLQIPTPNLPPANQSIWQKLRHLKWQFTQETKFIDIQ